ncbi:MAG TPA: Hsp20/alpha crystallin family protein [Allosphingosinicella sp.]|nr:Hsp20/alpha crystallin family protein [Allosphingosinicella sp.]
MRDLIPWGRQENRAPALFGSEERSPFLSLRRDIDRLFDDFFQAPMWSLGRGAAMPWPNVEVSQTEKEIRITAEVPGMNENDVELLVEDGILTLRGEKTSQSEDSNRGYSERFYGRFERRIALPPGVDEEKAKAEFRDGVLSVTLPRNPEAERGRRIPINGGTRH